MNCWLGITRRNLTVFVAAVLWSNFSSIEAFAGWRVKNETIQYSGDYEFQIKVYTVNMAVNNGNPVYLDTQPANYVGAFYNDPYGWTYKWNWDYLYLPADQQATVIYKVEYKYLNGNWQEGWTASAVSEP